MRIRSLTVALTLTALVGTACSTDDESTVSSPQESTAEAEHNEADVAFAQGMVPHHRQAIEMAQLASDRSDSASVRDLAARIEAAQAPEIEQLTAWLEDWDEDVPSDAEHSGMDMGDADMGATDMSAGMMSAEEMDALDAASGPDFDRLFLELMTMHHEGAVEMAQEEIERGSFPEAIAMAEEIVSTQKQEIDEMGELLSGVG